MTEVTLVQCREIRDKRGRENKRVRDKGEIECESESKTKSENKSVREHRERDIKERYERNKSSAGKSMNVSTGTRNTVQRIN